MSNNNKQKKVILIAPTWEQKGHLATIRIDRFKRWLEDAGFFVVIVKAGFVNEEREEPWGIEITVRDPLGVIPVSTPGSATMKPRKPNNMRRSLAIWMFNPDPSVVWAILVTRNSFVRAQMPNATFILSSNPTESMHICAWILSKKYNIPHIVDMRDGWLDEPLKPILINSAFRRWSEGKMESKILGHACGIFVTSEVWRDLLCKRLPNVANKVKVLTNSYPTYMADKAICEPFIHSEEFLTLIHAGRLSGSNWRRTPELLFTHLLNGIMQSKSKGVIQLIGTLTKNELDVIGKFEGPFKDANWQIECIGFMQREQLLKQLVEASGLILFSISQAGIPAKLFEYIPTKRPLLVITEKDSATWRICEKLPQAIVIDSKAVDDYVSVLEFLWLSGNSKFISIVPEDYTEQTTKHLFLDFISKRLNVE